MEPTLEPLKNEKATGKKVCITNKILSLMDKRRSERKQCKETQWVLQIKTRKAKESYYKEKCEEIEELLAKHDIVLIYIKKIKERRHHKTKTTQYTDERKQRENNYRSGTKTGNMERLPYTPRRWETAKWI